MPGLVPGIHVFTARKKDVDGRDKPGHDGGKTRPQIVDKTRRISGQALRMRSVLAAGGRVTAFPGFSGPTPSSNRHAGQGDEIHCFGYDHSSAIRLEPSSHVGVRNRPHQVADFRLQIFVRHDQRLHRVAGVTAASRDGLVGCRLKPVGVGLWIGRDALRHERFRVDLVSGHCSLFVLDVNMVSPSIGYWSDLNFVAGLIFILGAAPECIQTP
jgi:hypothetical protein